MSDLSLILCLSLVVGIAYYEIRGWVRRRSKGSAST